MVFFPPLMDHSGIFLFVVRHGSEHGAKTGPLRAKCRLEFKIKYTRW